MQTADMSDSPVIEKVTRERWWEAQEWERHHWVRTQRLRSRYCKNTIWRLLAATGFVPKHRGDDWNVWWRTQFSDYNFLPVEVENAIEVGCGPYTNVRLMLDRCKMRHLVLSDPLIRTYVHFKLTFVAEMYRKAACILDDHPLEELPFAPDYFDLAVMINVLDHVQDADRCMRNLVNVIRPGGLLIVGQDLTNEEDLRALQRDPGAVGHPIKLDHKWFEPHVQRFQPVIKKVLNREQSREPHQHYGALIFSGRKL
jgi:2-polyprenyl-6-hydroxyphenyl methylase/3-demethylubiquinone-9 3-methyltransferase